MLLSDLIQTIYFNFKQSKGRFILTLSGISLGIALLVIVGCFLKSADKTFIKTHQEANEANVVSMIPQSVPEKDRYKTRRQLELYDAAASKKELQASDASVSYERRLNTVAYYRDKSKNISFSGVSIDAIELYKLEIRAGRFFNNDDFIKRRRVCIVGEEVHNALKPNDKSLLGELITIERTQFRVVGLLERKPFLGKTSDLFLWDRKVIIPVTTFRTNIRPSTAIDVLFVRLHSLQDLEKRLGFIKQNIKNLILRRHYGVENFKFRDQTEEDVIGQMMEKVVGVLFIGIASLALLVGGINIMNIMLITVTERTREIGIRRAVGCQKKTLLKQFLLEAGFISLTGGIVGIIGGLIFSYLLALILNFQWGDWVFIIDYHTVVAGTIVSFLTGVIFGLYPAFQATKLSPEQCLRYE